MIDKICLFFLEKIKKEIPDMDDERAEVILYGLQILIGEIPKMFIIFGIAYLLGVLKLTVISVLLIIPYRNFSGGFHLQTHIGCTVTTILMYCGVALIGKYLVIANNVKIILAFCVWLFGMLMVKLYAPADTENVPILSEKQRRKNKILSYITLSLGMALSLIIKVPEISTILIFGNLVQSITITKFAYKLTKCKYGYRAYQNA